MKGALLAFITLSACIGWAQATDSLKTKPANSLSKYQQPSRFGPTQPATTSVGHQVPNFEKTTQSRVKSTYTYDKGRITGGSTRVQLGKKKN